MRKDTFQTIKYKSIYIHLHMEDFIQIVEFEINNQRYLVHSLDYAKKVIRNKLKD